MTIGKESSGCRLDQLSLDGICVFPFGDGDVLGARQTCARQPAPRLVGHPLLDIVTFKFRFSIAFKSTPIKYFRFQTAVSILRARTEQVGGRHETYR
jgi:hypothetical protein